MRRHGVFVAVVVLVTMLLGVTGCVTTQRTSSQAFEQAVKGIWVKYCSLWIAGDIDNWIRLWDDGGVQLPPGAPMKMSVAEIAKSSKDAQAAYQWTKFTIDITGSFVDETYGFVYGNYSYTFAPRKGGASISAEGKYETIFKRQADGSWKIFRDCFNSNTP
jgi:ketosteroid isomerase-like protein